MSRVTAFFRSLSWGLAVAVSAAGLVVVAGVGCDETGSSGAEDMGDDWEEKKCVQTEASTAGQPFQLAADGTAQRLLCPQGRVDWYAITVPVGQDLVDVDVGYVGPETTKIALQAQLYASDGTTAIANADLLDTIPDDGLSHLVSTFRAPPGSYLLQIQAANKTYDYQKSYVLKVAYAKDPDTHEPNDSAAEASVPDGQPGWFSYKGDVDTFKVTVPSGRLLRTQLSSIAGALAELEYSVQSGTNAIVGQGKVIPGQAIDEYRAMASGGDFFVVIAQAAGAKPDRSATGSYTLSLSDAAELDTHDQGTRNDSIDTATCLDGSGNGAACGGTVYTGTTVSFPAQTGQVGSVADNDFYRFEVGAAVSSAAVLEARVAFPGALPATFKPALTLLVPDVNTPCTVDSDCDGLRRASPTPATCSEDADCEGSHACLPRAQYKQCASTTTPCRLCRSAGLCVPYGGTGPARACAETRYSYPQPLDLFPTQGSPVVYNSVSWAEPLWQPGPVYIRVSDFSDSGFLYGTSYTLTVRVTPEADPNDATYATRNNHFNPLYPHVVEVGENYSRAVDVDATLKAGTPVTGILSYQNDEDWYTFNHPCPGMTCRIEFASVQPASPYGAVGGGMAAQFVVRVADSKWCGGSPCVREAWGYTGAIPVASPVNLTFGDAANTAYTNCSFAEATTDNTFYVQVRDVRRNWDVAAQYSFRLVSPLTPPAASEPCPAACSYNAPECACHDGTSYCSGTIGP